MTKEFIEIVLTKLINERDMFLLDMTELENRETISTDEKSSKMLELIDNLTRANNNIETFTGMLPEDVLTEPQTEDNNNK